MKETKDAINFALLYQGLSDNEVDIIRKFMGRAEFTFNHCMGRAEFTFNHCMPEAMQRIMAIENYLTTFAPTPLPEPFSNEWRNKK